NKFYKNLSLSIHSIEQSTSTSSHLNIQLEQRQLIQSYKRKSDTLHADNHDQNEIPSTTRTSLQQYIETENEQKIFKSN
ncbi:unnamed protein product, partial [Rotaria sp. Silwood1]